MHSDSQHRKTETHIPSLGNLGIALLEHFIEPIIGKDAIKAIKEPYIKQEFREKINNALSQTEKKFIQQHSDKELAQAITSLPIGTLPTIQEAVQQYWQDPFDPNLSIILQAQLSKDFSNLENDRISIAVKAYLDILRRELVLVSRELRDTIHTLIQFENRQILQEENAHLEDSVEYLKSIDQKLMTIVEHMGGNEKNEVEKTRLENMGEMKHEKDIPVHIIEPPGGTMDPTSPFYIERDADERFLKLVSPHERKGVTVTIKAPRQMGKSSLLTKGIAQALNNQKRVVYIDFEQFSEKAYESQTDFLKQFCIYIAKDLGLALDIKSYWDENLDPIRACTDFMEYVVFKSLTAPLVLALDEVDLMLGSPLCSEYFGMLRSWHNLRWKNGWKSLDLLMVISTEPYMLINKASQSPFNVSPPIVLSEFTEGHVSRLNLLHGSPLTNTQLAKLLEWFGGQPYLTRLALYEVAVNGVSFEDVIEKSCEDNSPFADHLWRYLEHLMTYPELKEAMVQVITNGTCSFEKSAYRLRSAGLVRIDGKLITVRNKLYEHYFRSHLL